MWPTKRETPCRYTRIRSKYAHFEWLPINGLSPQSRVRGVSPLCDEPLDHPVEYAAIVISLEAELHKISTGQWTFPGPQFNVHVPNGGLENHLLQQNVLYTTGWTKETDFFCFSVSQLDRLSWNFLLVTLQHALYTCALNQPRSFRSNELNVHRLGVNRCVSAWPFWTYCANRV